MSKTVNNVVRPAQLPQLNHCTQEVSQKKQIQIKLGAQSYNDGET